MKEHEKFINEINDLRAKNKSDKNNSDSIHDFPQTYHARLSSHRSDNHQGMAQFITERTLRHSGSLNEELKGADNEAMKPSTFKRRKIESLEMPHFVSSSLIQATPHKSDKQNANQ